MFILYAAIIVVAVLVVTVLMTRRSSPSVTERFISALDAGQVILHQEPIWKLGRHGRVKWYRGTAHGSRFVFSAKTDADGTFWIFSLAWSGQRTVGERWEVLKGHRERSLASIYFALSRLSVPREGAD